MKTQLTNFSICILLVILYSCTISLLIFSCNKISHDKSLFYEEAGEGEAILLIHGSQEDYRAFLPQLELLKEDFRVITYSRKYNYPNNNQYKEGTPFNPMTEAEDVETLRNKIGLKKFHVVGHSYGGLIAMAYAIKYQNNLKSLIVSEPPVLNIAGCEESLKATEEGLLKKLNAAFASKDSTLVMKSIFEFFVGQDIQDQIPTEALNALKVNLTEMKALASSKNPFPKLDTSFEIPTMILTSEHTMPILNCTNEALVNNMPNAKHVHISEASHDMWMTHSKIIADHLKNFISKK